MARLLDIYNKRKAEKARERAGSLKLPEPAADAASQMPNPKDTASRPPSAAAEASNGAPKELPPPPSARHEVGLLTAECTERRAFEAEKHIVLEGTAPRIQLGTIITREFLLAAAASEEPGEITGDSSLEGIPPYILNFAKRPRQVKGHLSLVGADDEKMSHEDAVQANFYRVVFEALEQAKTFALPPGTGPFADVDGAIKMYADHLFQGGIPADAPEKLFDYMERIIDSRPFASPSIEAIEPRLFRGHSHVYNEGVETPDDPINASLILTTASRFVQDEVSNAVSLSIAHPFEPYLIGVAALRSRNVQAYLGQVLVPYEMGEKVPDYLVRDSLLLPLGRQSALAAPIIAIIDPAADVALRVFRMSRIFPPIGAIDILSDTAAEGAAYAIRAEMRVKHLAYEIIRRAQEGTEPLNEAEYQLALTRIARCLFQSAKRWDGNPLIPRALQYAESGVREGVFSMSIVKFGEANCSNATIEVAAVARELMNMGRPELFTPQDEIQSEARDIAAFARTAGAEAAKTIQAVLGAWLKKAGTNKEE